MVYGLTCEFQKRRHRQRDNERQPIDGYGGGVEVVGIGNPVGIETVGV